MTTIGLSVQEIVDLVNAFLQEREDVPPLVTSDTPFDELQLDSLAQSELFVALEEADKHELDPETLTDIRMVADLARTQRVE